MLSCGWQSIRLEGSNRLGISSRIGKVIPKGDNKWEKGKLICIGARKNMLKLIRMVRVIAYIYKWHYCRLICKLPVANLECHYLIAPKIHLETNSFLSALDHTYLFNFQKEVAKV